MPTYWIKSPAEDAKSTRMVPRYRFPADWEAARDRILDVRKKAIRLRDEMLAFQKAASRDRDFETARFFSDEAAHHLKHYRACTFLAPWLLNDVPNDCRLVDREEWAMELHAAMDSVLNGVYDGNQHL